MTYAIPFVNPHRFLLIKPSLAGLVDAALLAKSAVELQHVSAKDFFSLVTFPDSYMKYKVSFCWYKNVN